MPTKKVRFKSGRKFKLTPHLIRMIASLVHQAKVEECHTNERIVPSDYASFGIEPSKFKTSANFPYNMARVCRSWWDAVRRVPEFWTDFTINIAKDPARMLYSLGLSKNLPLTVCITTNLENPVGTRAIVRSRVTEKRRIEAVVSALQPHLWRCTSIVMRVNWESNLPLLNRLILLHSTELRVLICQCRLIESVASLDINQTTHNWHADEDGWSNDHTVHRIDPNPVDNYDYEPGKITAMAVTGRQYADAVLHSPGIFESMAGRVDHLAISYFSFEPPIFRRGVIDHVTTEEHFLTVQGFFELLSKLRPRDSKSALGLYLSFLNTKYTPSTFLEPHDEAGTSFGLHHTVTHPASFNFISFNTVNRYVFWEINQYQAISLSSTKFCRFRNCVLVSPFGSGATLFGVILENMDDPVSVCCVTCYTRYTISIFRACIGLNEESARAMSLSRFGQFGFPLANRTKELVDYPKASLYILDIESLTDSALLELVNGYAMKEDGESALRMVVYRNDNQNLSRKVVELLSKLKDVHVDLGTSSRFEEV